MNNLSITVNGTEYPLATTLRVAYVVQGQHNHKPYTEVFKAIGEMTVEDQIGIIFASFKCANPDMAEFMPQKKFTDYCLDHMNLKDLMDKMQAVIKGITGEEDEPEQTELELAPEGATSEGN